MKSKFSKLLAIVLCLVMAVGSVAAVVEGDVPLNAETPVTETVVDEAVPETAVDETAAEEAPIVAAPSDPAAVPETLSEGETPVCTCPDVEGVDKTAADYVHLEGCPLYVAPAEPATEGETSACTCDGTDEEKAAEDFEHQKGCPLFYPQLYKKLMATTTTDEFFVLVDGLTEEDEAEFKAAVTEEELDALKAHILEIAPAAPSEPQQTENFTDAGPFMPAVTVQAAVSKIKLFAAPRAAKSGIDAEGLETTKTATAKADGSYTVSIDAYTTGTVTTTTTTTPVDIVLVLDQSGSMQDDFTGAGSRQAAMKSAVTNFISEVNKKYDATTADHRIAIVTFGSNAGVLKPWTFVDNTGMTTLQGKVSGLTDSPTGATNVAAGMTTAEMLMGAGYGYSGVNTTRQKVVIVFTDGVPTTKSDFSTSVATDAIASSKRLKASGATVYTVGIFDGAQKDQLYGDTYHYLWSTATESCSGEVGSIWNSDITTGDGKEQDKPAGNRFLNFLSSNFPDASGIGIENKNNTFLGFGYYGYIITENFTRISDKYYLTAKDSTALNTIFQQISNDISTPSIQLGSDTEIRDVVSQYFTIPDNATVSLYTAAYTGNGAFAAKTAAPSSVMATVSGDTVSVTGFDYNTNFIYDKDDGSFGGKKLIIEFTVNAKDGFWGGNNVPTNDAASGVYTGDTCIENFEQPEVNVPISVPDITATDKNIYLLNTAPTATELCNYAAPTEAWKTAFVNVTGPTADKTVSNTADTADITLTVTASPKHDGTGADGTPATAVSKTATASVNVFRPTVTYQDSSIYLGETAPAYETANYKSTAWMHGDTRDTTVTMTDAKPTLAFAYAPAAAAFEKDTDVKVAVQIGATDVTEYTKFVNADDASTGHQFTVKVKTCTLTITKSGAAGSGEGFIFDVTGAKNLTVSVQDNGTVKITGLPIGDYTVTEQGGWSWRYTASSTGTATLGKDNPNGSVTMNNTRTDNTLLDGSAYAQNNSAAYTVPVNK